MRYMLGVLAAVFSGLAFTASSIAQKRAINAIGIEAPLFRNLIKSPLWLAGFAVAFVVGAPLNMVAYMAIGPTLPPALNSISLASLPILARIFLGERPQARYYLGAITIAFAIACIGFSGIAIAPESIDWLDKSFLLRFALGIGCLLAFSAACIGFGLHSRSSGLIPLALAAGATQALANALMAPISGQLGLLVSGKLGLSGILIAGVVSAALAATNFGAIAIAQCALRKGNASLVIPLQQLPVQIVPIILHAVIYRGNFGGAREVFLLTAGIVLLLAGAFALSGKAKTGKVLALTFCLVLAVSSAPRLGAQENIGTTRVYRYGCLDATGGNAGIIDMRVTQSTNDMEIVSTDSSGLGGYARLGPGMVQEEVRMETASGKILQFKLVALGNSWETEGGTGKTCSRKGNAWLGDRSLFFVLPTLVNLKTPGSETRFVLIRPEAGQRATMRLRVEGIVDVLDFYGKKERAYRISMELADPIGLLFWPYTYNYYYRVRDLLFFAYDGPDENKQKSSIVLMESRDN